MKQLEYFCASMLLTAFAFLPALVFADDALDDLDVTMEVLNDETEINDVVSEMRGPSVGDIGDEALDDDEESEADNDGEDGVRDDSRSENDFDDDEESDGFDDEGNGDSDDLDSEDDFESEDGDDVDDEDSFDDDSEDPDDEPDGTDDDAV